MYELGTENFAPGPSYAQYRTKGSDFGSGTKESAVETLTTKFLRDGIIGTPEQCAERVAAHRQTINPSELVVLNGVGTMPADVAERSMRLFCREGHAAVRRHPRPGRERPLDEEEAAGPGLSRGRCL